VHRRQPGGFLESLGDQLFARVEVVEQHAVAHADGVAQRAQAHVEHTVLEEVFRGEFEQSFAFVGHSLSLPWLRGTEMSAIRGTSYQLVR
jgi:hypothetical protein